MVTLNTILLHSRFAIFIHKTVAFERGYIFKLKEIANLDIYAYLVDNDIKTIVIRNDSNKSVQISRNFCLENLLEIDFLNALHINVNQANFVLKSSKYIHNPI